MEGNISPAPYQNVPKTFTKLVSVPNLTQFPSSWRTIPAGAIVEYVAHEEILLDNGFEAQEGCDFYAYIVPCYACENNSENVIVKNQIEEKNEDYAILENKITPPFYSGTKQNEESIIYPNPTNGTFHIRLDNVNESIKQICISNMLGSEMLRKNKLQNNEEIDISSFPSGLYVVRVLTNENKTYFGKLVKE